ncbi:rhabdoid tumor deletion region protein 1, partial [Asbolus verrucosus]
KRISARGHEIITDPDFEPPFFRLTSEQPDIPIDGIDPTRRPVAFGKWALPKLRRELHHKDELVVIQALTSICDLVHDPEKAYEAINLKIPDRLTDLLVDPLAPIRERAVLALSILAGSGDGKDAIVKNIILVENLKLCLGDTQPSIRLKTAACTEIIARTWMAADVLVEREFIESLLKYVEDEFDKIIELHLETLKSLMYGCGKCVALKNDGFKVFDIPTCTSAASVIMFCTVKTKAKHLAADIKTLPKRLIKLSTNPLNPNLQMYCL